MVDKPNSEIEITSLATLQTFISNELPEKYLQRYMPKIDHKNPDPKNVADVKYYLENLPINRKEEFMNLILSKIMDPAFAKNFNETRAVIDILPNNEARREYLDRVNTANAKGEIKALTEPQNEILNALRTQFGERTLGIIEDVKARTEKFISSVRKEIIAEICASQPLKQLFADAIGLELKSVTKRELHHHRQDLDRFIVSYVPVNSTNEALNKIQEPSMQIYWAQKLMGAMDNKTPKKCIDAAQEIFTNPSAKPYLKNDKRSGFWNTVLGILGLKKGQSLTRFFDKKLKTLEGEIKTASPDSPRAGPK